MGALQADVVVFFFVCLLFAYFVGRASAFAVGAAGVSDGIYLCSVEHACLLLEQLR